MEPTFSVTISGDHNFYEQLRSGNDITIKTPKNCVRCKRKFSHRHSKFSSSRSGSVASMPERHAWKPNPLHEDGVSLISEPVATNYVSRQSCNTNYTVRESTEKRINLKDPFEKIFRSNYCKKDEIITASTSIPPFIVVNVPKSQNFQQSMHETSTIVSEGIKCRYCYNIEDENLITPCRCSGSSKFVHKSCLEKWLTLKNKNECEICKTKYNIRTSFNPIWALRFPSMDKRDAALLFITLSFYITLILQFLGAVFIGVSEPTAIPHMMRSVTLTGLSLGLLWFLIGAIFLTIIVYTSRYWEEFRKMNRQKTLIIDKIETYNKSSRSINVLADTFKSDSNNFKKLPNYVSTMNIETFETTSSVSASNATFDNDFHSFQNNKNQNNKLLMSEKNCFLRSNNKNEGDCITVSVDFEATKTLQSNVIKDKSNRQSITFEDKSILQSGVNNDKSNRQSKIFDEKNIRNSKVIEDRNFRNSKIIEDKNIRHSRYYDDQSKPDSLGRRSRRNSSRSYKKDETISTMLPIDLSLAVAV
ncbi:uncharacterized protein LOC100201468 isoform X1 [Hydra vulgaris]|uniref:uncharacterized protein LOC100201468 isoform X1 n=1 Tax=Hydra vulgaris TaxID=6087 RepID=UPI000640E1EE|nr:uncharacterized protein LOC100201468 [Hydra vulgaris]